MDQETKAAHRGAMMVTSTVRTGVYATHQRRMCVVVRVKEGKVHLLHFQNSTVQLEVSFVEKFVVDYPVHLYNYPAIRATRLFVRYVKAGFSVTPEARKIINSILQA